MEAQLPTNAELHKAWHLLSLLLRIGRPLRPSDLASRCVLFKAPMDYVAYLCSIPNSPICLTGDLFVTASVIAFVAFRKFASNLSAIDWLVPRVGLGVFRLKRSWEDAVRTYCRRRKRLGSEFEAVPAPKKRAVSHPVDKNDENWIVSISPCGILIDCAKEGGISIMKLESDNFSRVVGKEAPFSASLNAGLFSYGLNINDHESSKEISTLEHMREHQYAYTPECQQRFLNIERFPRICHSITVQRINASVPHPEQSVPTNQKENAVAWSETKMGEISFRNRTSFSATSCAELQHSIIPPDDFENVGHGSVAKNVGTVEGKRVFKSKEVEKPLIVSICHGDEIEHVPAVNTAQMVMPHVAKRMNVVPCIDMIPFQHVKKTTADVESEAILPAADLSVCQKQPMKSSPKSKNSLEDALNLKKQDLCKAMSKSKAVGSLIENQQRAGDKNSIYMKQKLKQNFDQKMYSKKKGEKCREKRDEPIAPSLNNQQEPKPLPNFEKFTVEEEEGSGGYGTVYRAQRENDGVTFAIKCPHANANRYHVHNELKMLERFGGKNFVIKYEGSFTSGNSECLVLEHVEHDRPEILKREIDVFQLQWYGYCMFRALAGLHKQGIVHRDVKPGNFLFSRKVNKGYLIDFNLAMDLHQKYGTTDKSKVGYDTSFNHVPLVHTKSLLPNKQRFLIGKSLEVINQDTGRDSKPHLLLKNVKKKVVDQTNAFSELGSTKVMKSQGADGSGITSVKDGTSTRTPSTERLREPIPCHGRKELISLVHKAMQSPNYESQSVPASKRKRVAALPRKVDRKLVYPTPMPIYSTGVAVGGASLTKNKGDGKQKREGPCVGTKGFRAPEVLFRSAHQGPKVDVWSAGVTLLYLMIGRTPFTGEPEQNIKEIAKLRGNEDLWEVATLHNCKSSFPVDLYDVQFLPSMRFRDWCKQNTKRPDFFEIIPKSLFDLVDKCLTVNPRLRISAEEALRHEFLSPCLGDLRRKRLLRKGLSLDSGTTHILHRQSEICEGLL